jgi:hypothetical protein
MYVEFILVSTVTAAFIVIINDCMIPTAGNTLFNCWPALTMPITAVMIFRSEKVVLEDGRVATWGIFAYYISFYVSLVLMLSSIATVSKGLRKVYNGVHRQIRWM